MERRIRSRSATRYHHAMGPLTGIRVLEFEGIGPGPFCGMMLADMGADVLLVDREQDARLGFGRVRNIDVMFRGRRSATLDLKSPDGVRAALTLVDRADAVIEGNRPGVMAIVNIMIGLVTPPYGLLLFMMTKIADVPLRDIVVEALPFLYVMIGALALITLVPDLVLFLPRIMGYKG
jgi:hypothetical protein